MTECYDYSKYTDSCGNTLCAVTAVVRVMMSLDMEVGEVAICCSPSKSLANQ